MKKVSIMREIAIERMEQVYYTKDYDKFKMLEDNRAIKINKDLKESITNKGILEPITVNEYMQILDGQHRFSVAKALNVSVPFKVVSGLKLIDILDTKATTKNWTANDYIDFFAKKNNKSYIKLKNMMKEEKLDANILISMYHKGNLNITGDTKWNNRILREGSLNMFAHTSFGNEALAKFREIVEFMPSKECFAKRAIFSILKSELYDHGRMISQLTKHGNTVLFNSNGLKTHQYCAKLREVYNYRQRDKVMIYTEDLV